MVVGYKATKYRIRALNSGDGKHNTTVNLFCCSLRSFRSIVNMGSEDMLRRKKKRQDEAAAKSRKKTKRNTLGELVGAAKVFND